MGNLGKFWHKTGNICLWKLVLLLTVRTNRSFTLVAALGALFLPLDCYVQFQCVSFCFILILCLVVIS